MNLAIVGCGMVANEHLKALKRVNGISVVALCDKDEETVNRMSKKWNIRSSYTDYSKMMNDQDLSIVSILTPPQAHVPVALEAIKRGINVVMEKPLTPSSGEARPLLDALKQSKVKLTVDHTMLFSRAMDGLTSLLRRGELGEVLGAAIQYLCTPDDSMAANQNHWSHSLPGGRFGEMLPHPIYAIQAVIGNDLVPDRVATWKRGKYPWMAHDELKVLFRNEKTQTWGDMYVSFNSIRPVINLVAYGTRRIVVVDVINQTLMELGKRGLGRLDSAQDLITQSGSLLRSTISNATRFLSLSTLEYPLQNMYRSFVTNISSGTEPLVTAEAAYETVRVTEQVCSQL